MAYGAAHRNYFSSEWEASTAEDLSAAAADHVVWGPPYPVRVVGWGFVLTEASGTFTTTSPVVSLDLRPTANSDTNRAEKSTLTIPSSKAVGTVVVSTTPKVGTGVAGYGLTPFDVKPGQEVVFEHKTQGAGGTTTGAGHYFVVYEEEPEHVSNDTTTGTLWVEVAS